jgi:ATP-binding cassette subfamily F protein 3
MLRFQEVSLQRGGRWLFRDVSFDMYGGEKVGVVGANGTGKSSLMGLIKGVLEPDEGSVVLEGQPRIGYVEQTVTDLSADLLSFVVAGDRRFVELRSQLLRTDDPEWPQWQETFEHIGGYRREAEAQAMLAGLGFAPEQVEQPLGSLSGGWQVRASLARALLTPCDLLLLDEPTNHLDLPAIRWLENWLQRFSGAVLCVSHDGHFLDAFAQRILHVDQTTVTSYTGNYSEFLQRSAERQQLLAAQMKKVEQRQKQLESFISRFRSNASKSSQAQSRLKQLEKLPAITRLLVSRGLDFTFAAPDRQPSPMVSVVEADIGYDAPLLKGVNLQIEPGQKVGLVGLNGSGKTTLLRTLVGEMLPLSGKVVTARGLLWGYFRQQTLTDLPSDASAESWVAQQQKAWGSQRVLDYLGRFGFSGERAKQPVSVMSGGEKTRLALAAMVAEPKHLLVLDEPTNHLDAEAREGLAAAISDFPGAVVLVSHDRRFLESTVDEFWLVHDAAVRRTTDDIDSLLESLKPSRPRKASQGTRDGRRERASQRQRLAPLKRRLKACEDKVAELTAELERLERRLTDDDVLTDPMLLSSVAREHDRVVRSLEDAEEKWLDLLSEWEQHEDGN